MSDTSYTIGEWLKLTQTGGEGSAIVTPSTNPHSMRDERNMTIQVSTTTEGSTEDNKTVDIEVKSEGVGPIFKIDDSNITELLSTATSIEIPIVRNNCKYVRYKVNESNTTIIEDVDVRELWLQSTIQALSWKGTNDTNSQIKINSEGSLIEDPGKNQLYENGYLGIHFPENTSRDNIKTLNFDIWGEMDFDNDDKNKIGKKTINITQEARGVSVSDINITSGNIYKDSNNNILLNNQKTSTYDETTDTYSIQVADAVHGFTITGNSNSKGILIKKPDSTNWDYTVLISNDSGRLITCDKNTGHIYPDIGLDGGDYNFSITFTNVYSDEGEISNSSYDIKLIFLGKTDDDNKSVNIKVLKPIHPEIPSKIEINYSITLQIISEHTENTHSINFGIFNSKDEQQQLINTPLTLNLKKGSNEYKISITNDIDILNSWGNTIKYIRFTILPGQSAIFTESGSIDSVQLYSDYTSVYPVNYPNKLLTGYITATYN